MKSSDLAKKHLVVFIYNSYNDPLFKGILLPYLLRERENNRFVFHLITYEQKDYKVTLKDKREVKRYLLENNIHWFPLKWYSRNGFVSLFLKAYDVLAAFVLIGYLKGKYSLRGILSLGTVAGSMAYLLSITYRLKMYLYQYEMHSEFLKDYEIWNEKDISFKILNYLERKSAQKANVIATGTSHMVDRLSNKKGVSAQLFRLPSCIDDLHFVWDSKLSLKSKIGFDRNLVILYVGKFGGIYYTEEVFQLFKSFLKKSMDTRFLIVTPQDHGEIAFYFDRYDIPRTHYHITSAEHQEVRKYINSADIGLVTVAPLPSQKYRSPIKVGEYLCCGLPYLVCRGVSEDDIVAEEYDVGVVLEDFTEESLNKAYPKILSILNQDKRDLAKRCRRVGQQYRGFTNGKIISDKIFRSFYEMIK